MANQGGGGNGHSGEDVIVTMISAVKRLQDSLVRHQGETKDSFKQVNETTVRMQEAIVRTQEAIVRMQEEIVHMREALARTEETVSQHHREEMEDIGQITEILAAVGHKLRAHDRRLAAVEAKVL
ncbi:MAG TPA: hypothetical protein VFB81_07380 [Myxococcales bacterium]|nr:hypothetical protein [Myxococcales bacterium]